MYSATNAELTEALAKVSPEFRAHCEAQPDKPAPAPRPAAAKTAAPAKPKAAGK